MTAAVAARPRTLTRRLLPLQFGVALQGLILWVPIEKVFMTEIGFDAASVGAMAAAYAAVVPLLEVPSGILADRWSRSWTLILACVALMVSSLIGGLSHNVITYVIAAMILGSTSRSALELSTASCTTRCWRRPARTSCTRSG